jgi:hypothetical protein
MTISSLNQTSEAFAAALPGLNARKPEELLPESDLVELSEDARTAQRQDTIGSADSLPGQGTRGSSEARDAADLPELAFSAPEEEASPNSADGHDHAVDGAGEQNPVTGEESEEESSEQEIDSSKKSSTGETLSEEEQAEVQNLRERDREVRTHEQAHVAAGGSHVRGGIKYEYQAGPDGRRYAVGGEVSIDTSPVSGDPQKTIQKAQQIRRAALAPAEPSGADRQAAAAAAQMEAAARTELIETRANPTDEGAAPSSEAEALDGSAEAGSEATSERAGGVEPAGLGDRKPNAPISASAPEAVSPDGGPGPLEPPETEAPEMSDLVQGIEDRADESGGSAAQRVATLSYSFASEIPVGLLDVTT